MLDVGTRRQLLFDERFIEQSESVRLRMHRPVQHAGAVLSPDRPWESQGIGAYNTVMLDDGRWRMWYDAGLKGGLPAEGARRLGYAESDDGLVWRKPDLGLIEFRGSKRNNLVAPLLERQSLQGATVMRDDAAPAPQRYRLWTKFRPTDDEIAAGARPGLWAMHSADGLAWRYDDNQPNPDGACDTQNMLWWDERLGLYVGYTRVSATQHRDEAAVAAGHKPYRSVGRVTSKDLRTWTPRQIVFEADGADLGMPLPVGHDPERLCVDVYTSCAMKVPFADDAYLMLPSVYYHWGGDHFPATMDVQLLTSRDGVGWRRAGDREPFLRHGADGSSTSGMLFANPWLIPVGDELWLYYAGTARHHGPPPPGTDEQALAQRSGIFRASLRRDGFVSVDAGYGGGSFTTPPLTFDGEGLSLNFDGSAGGWLQVEVLDESGQALPGLSLADCDAVTGNGVDKPVRWRGDLGAAAGTPVRLRFVMRGAQLYAFQFRDEA